MVAQERGQSSSVTNGERLASGSVFSFASIIATRVATVVNSIIIIRVLTVGDYGVLSVVTTTLSLAAIFTTLQTPTALVKFLAGVQKDDPDEASRLIGGGFALTAVSTVMTVAVLIALIPFLSTQVYQDPRLVWLLILASISLMISSVSSPFLSTFQGFEKIKELGVRTAAAALLSIPSTLVLVWFLSLQGAIISMIVNNCISLAVNLALLRSVWSSRRLKLVIPRDRAIYSKLLGYVMPAFGGALIVSAVVWFTTTYLAQLQAWRELGLYSAGSGLASYVLFISAAVGMPLVPMVSRLDRDSPDTLPHFMVRTMRIGAFLTLVPTLIVICEPEPLLRILYGTVYAEASNVVRIVAPAIFLSSISGLVGYGIAGKGQMKHGMLLNVIWSIPMVVVSIALIPTMKQNGLALAFLSAYVIQCTAALIFAKISWSVDLGQFAAILAIAAIAIPTAVFISLSGGMTRFALAFALTATVIFAGLYTMSKRELEVLTHPLRRMFSWVHREE